MPILNNKSAIYYDESAGAGENTFIEDIDGEDEELQAVNKKLTEYQKNCFLKFGYDNISDALDIAGTIEYLSGFGFDKN